MQVAAAGAVMREYAPGDVRREQGLEELLSGGVVSQGAINRAAHIDGGAVAAPARCMHRTPSAAPPP